MTREIQEAAGIIPETKGPKPKPGVGLHTLESDISAFIKEKDISLVDIAAETSKQRRFSEETKKTGKTFLISAGIILLIAGIAVSGWFLFFKKSRPVTETPAIEAPKALVFSDKREIITLKSESKIGLVNLIQKAAESLIPLNTIIDFPILLDTKEKKEYLAVSRFFEILEIKPPPNFIQSLEGNFTLGIYYLRKNEPFLIFEIRSFELALSGTLEWERNMAKDLKGILAIPAVLSEQKFQDKIIKNRDSRILYDTNGNPVLVYTFLNKQYLIIAVDLDTFEEIFRRFALPFSQSI